MRSGRFLIPFDLAVAGLLVYWAAGAGTRLLTVPHTILAASLLAASATRAVSPKIGALAATQTYAAILSWLAILVTLLDLPEPEHWGMYVAILGAVAYVFGGLSVATLLATRRGAG